MRLLLFIAIMLLFGSLSKPPVVPCSKLIVSRYYLKGKLVHVDKDDQYDTWGDVSYMNCEMHGALKMFVKYDSVSRKLK